jgi:predicted Zn-dependent peptidase
MLKPGLQQFQIDREVVVEERWRRLDAKPNGKLSADFLAAAFVVHPHGQPAIGWQSDI